MRPAADRHRYALDAVLFSPVSSGDTYLVSYPRSGSTWLRCMITTLVHGTEVTPEVVAATAPDAHQQRDLTRPAYLDPFIAKSHSLYLDMPAKVIYLVRDSRDATMSFFYYLVRRGRVRPDTPPHWLFFGDSVWLPPWHEHVTGWLDGLALARLGYPLEPAPRERPPETTTPRPDRKADLTTGGAV